MSDDAVELEAAGAEYRACKAETIAARVRWADAERALNATRTQSNPMGEPDAVRALDRAREAVIFSKACELAAGEAVKGESLADVLERNGTNGRPGEAA